MKRLNLIVDDYLHNQITKYAEEKHLLISEVVREILREKIPLVKHIEKEEIKKKKEKKVKISKEDKELLKLAEREDVTIEKLAEKAGVSIGTVYGKLRELKLKCGYPEYPILPIKKEVK